MVEGRTLREENPIGGGDEGLVLMLWASLLTEGKEKGQV